jgi:hypothetical protein
MLARAGIAGIIGLAFGWTVTAALINQAEIKIGRKNILFALA